MEGIALVIILDQFEELQGFLAAQVKCFAEALAGLFVSVMPDELYKEYVTKTTQYQLNEMTEEQRRQYSKDICIVEQPLSTRLLFVIREDKLGTMSLISNYFPDILKNDYLLQPLTQEGAKLAIAEPCKAEGDFIKPAFTFTPEAVTEVIEKIKNKKNYDGYYDPIVLQIICSNIEKKLPNGQTQVTAESLPKMKNAVREFYNDAWAAVVKETALEKTELQEVKKSIIEKLVVNRKRNLVLNEALEQDAAVSISKGVLPKVMSILVKEGLVKEITSGQDEYFQLVHDRFIEPAVIDSITIKDQQQIQSQQLKERKQAKWIYFGVLGLIILGAAAVVYYNAVTNAKLQEVKRVLFTMKTIDRAGNPTLSYMFGKNWNKTKKSDSVNHMLATAYGEKVYLSSVVVLPEDAGTIEYFFF